MSQYAEKRKLAKKLKKKYKEIYKLYKGGLSLKKIGIKYKLSRSTIGRILKSKNLKIRTGGETQTIHLTSKQKKIVKKLLKKKETIKFISRKIKIGTQPLYKFLKKNKLLPGVRYVELPTKKICKEYKSGMKVEDLAIKYKVNPIGTRTTIPAKK